MTDMEVGKIVESLAGIASKIGKMEHAREVHLEAIHGRFNLFTTLLKAHDEVRLHTRYLTHLLNPEGEHDCDRLFLDTFLDVVELSELKDQKCESVKNEHYTDGLGNIDIYIEFEKAVLVIENKIWADDQNEQLQRYDKYAYGKKKDAIYLFYLTLDGHPPSKNSLGNLDAKNCSLISYKKHILQWLGKCLRESYSFVGINQALQQYESVINRLLGNTLEKEDMEIIKNQIKNYPEIMCNASAVIRALSEIYSECEKLFYSEFQKKLTSLPEVENSLLKKDEWENKPFFSKRLTESIEIVWGRDGKVLFVAAFPDFKNDPSVKDKPKQVTVLNSYIVGGVNWVAIRYLLSESNSFSSNHFMVRMLDDSKREEKVKECFEQVVDFIKIIDGETKNNHDQVPLLEN